MKLNIVAILLFTLLLSTGFSTKSDAQCWRCHRYGYWAPEHAPDTSHCYGHWGCRPWGWGCRRWGCGDSKCCPAMAEWRKEDSTHFAKMHEEMMESWQKRREEDSTFFAKHHGDWHHGDWDGWYGRGWWGRPWRYDRYYYRGAGY